MKFAYLLLTVLHMSSAMFGAASLDIFNYSGNDVGGTLGGEGSDKQSFTIKKDDSLGLAVQMDGIKEKQIVCKLGEYGNVVVIPRGAFSVLRFEGDLGKVGFCTRGRSDYYALIAAPGVPSDDYVKLMRVDPNDCDQEEDLFTVDEHGVFRVVE